MQPVLNSVYDYTINLIISYDLTFKCIGKGQHYYCLISATVCLLMKYELPLLIICGLTIDTLLRQKAGVLQSKT